MDCRASRPFFTTRAARCAALSGRRLAVTLVLLAGLWNPCPAWSQAAALARAFRPPPMTPAPMGGIGLGASRFGATSPVIGGPADGLSRFGVGLGYGATTLGSGAPSFGRNEIIGAQGPGLSKPPIDADLKTLHEWYLAQQALKERPTDSNLLGTSSTVQSILAARQGLALRRPHADCPITSPAAELSYVSGHGIVAAERVGARTGSHCLHELTGTDDASRLRAIRVLDAEFQTFQRIAEARRHRSLKKIADARVPGIVRVKAASLGVLVRDLELDALSAAARLKMLADFCGIGYEADAAVYARAVARLQRQSR